MPCRIKIVTEFLKNSRVFGFVDFAGLQIQLFERSPTAMKMAQERQ